MKTRLLGFFNKGGRTKTLIINVVFALLASLVFSAFFFRIDLTSDKRYSLTDFTKKTLRNLDDIVYIQVYLDGELNIPFGKMKQGIRETLDEFRIYAGDNLMYEFVNPFEGVEPELQEEAIADLYARGLQPANIISSDTEGGTAEKIVFPGAVITYRDAEVPVNLLKNNTLAGAEANINNSIQSLEFEFIRVINTLSSDTVEKVAFLEGHGEFPEPEVEGLSRELSWFFQVDRGQINGNQGILDDYKAVIVAGPVLPFNEKDKFVIDQYIMNGGKVLWFLDMVRLSKDSLAQKGYTIAIIDQLNLEDMLFRYGVRINPVLIQDYQCNVIPLNMALPGNSPEFRFMPWYYYPLLNPSQAHPATRNLSQVKSEFTSDIDTTGPGRNIMKTILLSTSDLTGKKEVPALISLEEATVEPSEMLFNEKHKTVAMLLEGSFESSFKNRMITGIAPDGSDFRESGEPTMMLVVADADILRNEPGYPAGFDQYTQRTFSNKDFILNALHYMTGHEDLINLRNREIPLRLLDKAKLNQNRAFWLMFNTIGPPLVVIFAGMILIWLRDNKYGRGK